MKSKEKEIEEAIDEVKICMIENIRAGKIYLNASIEKEKVHYKLLKAKERLYALERDQ